MSSKSGEAKGLVKGSALVAIDRVITEEEADEIRADMKMKFTRDRGPTQMGAAQGEQQLPMLCM